MTEPRQSELEVLRLAADGLTYREVAQRLGRSHQTVKNQMRDAYEKLGVNSLVQAMNALGWVNAHETTQSYATPVQWWIRL